MKSILLALAVVLLAVAGCTTNPVQRSADFVSDFIFHGRCYLNEEDTTILAMAVYPASSRHYWRIPSWEKCTDSKGETFYRWQSREPTEEEVYDRLLSGMAAINISYEEKDNIIKMIINGCPAEYREEYYRRLYQNLK